jgi:hypothetical protein
MSRFLKMVQKQTSFRFNLWAGLLLSHCWETKFIVAARWSAGLRVSSSSMVSKLLYVTVGGSYGSVKIQA